jgi:hypothetical protein
MTLKLTLTEFLQQSTNQSTNLVFLPTIEELKLLRKGLRKKALPEIDLLPPEFSYEGVGKFSKKKVDSDISIVWTIRNCEPKYCMFSNLCLENEQEMNRLEFGWMIANFARLDSLLYLSQMRPISYEDHHQNQFNKNYLKQKNHFLKIENNWRHWAIVPAGHMLFS